jgi:UPF0755 protein
MIRKILRGTLALVVVGILFIVVWFSREYRLERPGLAPGTYFEVEKGQGVRGIAAALAKSGLIRSPLAFRLACRLYYPHASLKAGEYDFGRTAAMKDILEALTKGKVYLHPITLREGLTGEEMAEEFERSRLVTRPDFREAFAARDLIADWDPEALSVEGYLFPETYNFPAKTSAREIVGAMIAQFKTVFSDRWRLRAQELGLTIRQVTVLASLIEMETSQPEEKKLISAVFHNRLHLGMKLDCDPTIIYALKLSGEYEGHLRSRDLKLDSPYNTYRHAGLPPGPICNPGRASLEAALYPASEDYLYFVSRKDGSHQFSRSFREHQNAVLKFQKQPSLVRN